MSSNLFANLRRLLPGAPLQIALVVSAGASEAVVELPGGSRLTVRGAAAVGQRVFVRAGVIEGEAPDLPSGVIDV